MINIVCLKWGSKYGPEYVNRLYAAVSRNCQRSFRFWCLTEDAGGINPEVQTLNLTPARNLDSWWNKMFLFAAHNALPAGEQIFYIDLDTLIVDRIDDLLDAEQVPNIVVLRDFYHGIARTAGNVGSGLMSWRHGDYDYIWKEFVRDPEAAMRAVRPHGDQAWIEHCVDTWHYWQDLWPGSVVSFKMHCQQGIPPGAKIICYHGNPSIPESVTYRGQDWRWKLTPQPWVLDHWRD